MDIETPLCSFKLATVVKRKYTHKKKTTTHTHTYVKVKKKKPWSERGWKRGGR